MTNWAEQYLKINENLSGRLAARLPNGLVFKQGNQLEAHFVMFPAHWWNGSEWNPYDTDILHDTKSNLYGTPWSNTRLTLTGAITILHTGYAQHTRWIGLFNPTTRNLNILGIFRPGLIINDHIERSLVINGVTYLLKTILTERGLKEQLLIDAIPSGDFDDWLVIGTVIVGIEWSDGWIDTYRIGQYTFGLPYSQDADGYEIETKRFAFKHGGEQLILTGFPLRLLSKVKYPIVLDPDYVTEASDGYIRGNNSVYATARATSFQTVDNAGSARVGQDLGYNVYRGYFRFNTGTISPTATVTQANLKMAIITNTSTTDFNVNIQKYDWTAPLNGAREANYDGALAATLDQVWRNTLGIATNTIYTSPNLDITRVNPVGYTYFAVISSRDASATPPTTPEHIDIYTAEGTATYRAVLTVLFTGPVTSLVPVAGIEVDTTPSNIRQASQAGLEVDINIDQNRLIEQSGLAVDHYYVTPRQIMQVGLEIDIFLAYPSTVLCPPLPLYKQAQYLMRLYDHTGTQVAIIDNLKNLEIEHTLNSFSSHVINIDGRHPRVSSFILDYFVEIQRKLYGGNWYTEYIGFHRTSQRQITEGRHRIFTSYGRGLLDLINRRCIMYPATSGYTLKGGPGETVIKQYVNENISSGANNPVRWNPLGSLGIGIEPDLAQGLYWAGQRTARNLLEVIQEISSITSIDFDIIWTPRTANFMFKTYYPQRGTDRRHYMAFDPLLGNMINPSYTYSRTEEATVVIVLGSGTGLNRKHLMRQGATLYDSPWNSIEITKDARNEDSVASYITEGDEALAEASPKESFTFEVLQTADSLYGRDYFIGDIVTVRFDDIIRVKKIIGANIQMSEGKETIKLEFADLPIYR